MAAKKKAKAVAKKKPVAKAKAKAAKPKPKPKLKTKAAPKAKLVAKPVAKAKAVAKPVNVDFSSLITPLDDRLVVAPEEAETTTAGGLIIPGTVSARPSRGLVLAIGRGRRNKKGSVRPLDVSLGDQVMFAEFSGSKITVQGQEVLILREEDILGIVTA